MWSTLRHFEVGGLDDRSPLLDLAREVFLRSLRRSPTCRDVELNERLLPRFALEVGVGDLVHAINDRWRRPCGRHENVPGGRLETLVPEFVDSWHVGRLRRSLQTGDCERAKRTVIDESDVGD